jgi:hypothetical protein
MLAGGVAMAQPAPELTYASQGWLPADREAFYTTSQGSHMMPYPWFKALRRLDADEPFAADQLQRYGYLRNESLKNTENLPVGFVIDGRAEPAQIGMTCAACHTGQLEYEKAGTRFVLRIDGAPANADFQQFLADLTNAARATLNEPGRFDVFARTVLGANYNAASLAQLKSAFGLWVSQFGDFMDKSLPASPWGPGRLDAFGMIFNRVAARDLAVPGNFKLADAPVSYPFLWNATRQDHTQWNGVVPNGLFIQGLARNTGEVFGVFARFDPKLSAIPGIIEYWHNSADFAGLQTLEEKIEILKPPPWPRDIFGIDGDLAAKGKPLFDANCGQCHAERASPILIGAWQTPVQAVGTDPKMILNSGRTGNPGLYQGKFMPPPAFGVRFENPAQISDILAASVIGSLRDEAFLPLPITPAKLSQSGAWRALRKDFARLQPAANLDALNLSLGEWKEVEDFVKARLSRMYSKPDSADPGAAYEARVLHGVWATAPYLHNGSVPNLWELLQPPGKRKSTFMVGSRLFDPKNVGYAVDQSPFKNGTFTADPSNANGNGNLGHEFGTDLSEPDRWAIIEYLKTL